MQIIADRRALHQIPETEWNLPKTAKYVTDSLQKLSCQVFAPAENAVCAWFDFGAERTIAFRSDMDALPIQECNDLAYVSHHPGKMHACGHDAHMAMLLELARRIDAMEKLDKNVLLVFQPAEESPGGAKILCDTGILEKYRVEAIFGIHIWPELPEGQVFSRKGPLMARASETTVEFTGKASHIGRADRGRDAMAAAVKFYQRAMELEASVPDGVYRLLKFGKFHSGTARNIISAHTRMEGSLRVFDDELFDYMQENLTRIVQEVEAETGCKGTIHFLESYPAVCNPDWLFQRVNAITPIGELDMPSMVAEDFSWYQRQVPGILFFLGTGDSPALHASNFNFNEEIMIKGADFWETLVREF